MLDICSIAIPQSYQILILDTKCWNLCTPPGYQMKWFNIVQSFKLWKKAIKLFYYFSCPNWCQFFKCRERRRLKRLFKVFNGDLFIPKQSLANEWRSCWFLQLFVSTRDMRRNKWAVTRERRWLSCSETDHWVSLIWFNSRYWSPLFQCISWPWYWAYIWGIDWKAETVSTTLWGDIVSRYSGVSTEERSHHWGKLCWSGKELA